MAIFHKAHSVMYHFENSIRGIRNAARMMVGRGGRRRRRYDEIDLDLQITRDGVIVNTHWARPMMHDGFLDPQRKLDRHRTVASMTWAEVSRLRARGNYQINTIDTTLAACASSGIGARLEPKDDRRFESVELWKSVKAKADHYDCQVRGYSIRNLGGPGAGTRRVAAMNAAGIPSHTIR